MLRGTELESWPTPDAAVSNDGQDAETYQSRRRLQEKHRNGNGAGLVLAQAVQSRSAWPTATAGDAIGAGNRNLEGSKAHAGTSLTDAVNGGQRPRSSPALGDAQLGDDRGPSPGLEAAQARHAARGVHKQVSLRDQVPRAAGSASPWATPTRQDGANNGGPSQVDGRNTQPLNAQVRGALNPDWVETLMGWVPGWTSLEPLNLTDLRHWVAGLRAWPAPPGPQHDWEPPRLTPSYPGRTARLRMLGNGQVPATAVLAWRVLGGGR